MRFVQTLLIKAVKIQMFSVCLNLLGVENEAAGFLHTNTGVPNAAALTVELETLRAALNRNTCSPVTVPNSLSAHAQGERCTCLLHLEERPAKSQNGFLDI